MKNNFFFLKFLFTVSISLFVSFVFAQQTNSFSKNMLLGKEKIKLYGKGYQLQKEAYLSLERMRKAALTKNVRIHVVSSYRSFAHQNRIWSRKYKTFKKKGYSIKNAVNKVKEYSAIPGTSRHHWGTDVDLTDYNKKHLKNNLQKTKSQQRYEKWMDANAHKFGFYRTYTKNPFRKGYKYESWHYSYRKIAKPMLEEYMKLDIVSILSKEKIAGNSVFTKQFLKTYISNNVLGINMYLY